MERVNKLKEQLKGGLKEVPVVLETRETTADPIRFLQETAKVYPDLFYVDRGKGNKYLVVSDASMYEDILTFDALFGNPQAPNMLVNKTIFGIPGEQLDRHEQNAISGLRKYLLNHNGELADKIAKNLLLYMDNVLGDSGVLDLRNFGQAIFWPMTATLFGEKANKANAPYLFHSFENIDNSFGKALKGREVKEVKEGVETAKTLFKGMLSESRKVGGCPVGPLMKYYEQVTNKESDQLTASFACAAWWGGQGNTLPSTVWSFGLILSDPDVKTKCYEEVDKFFANGQQPDSEGHYDYAQLPYLTSCLKETLRLTTYSIAWRQCQDDATLTSKATGNTYNLPKGTLIGLHFALNHHSPDIYDDPETFRPERFLPYADNLSPVINGVKYAWVPFSAGRHKCSGYPLAMLEIPLAMALFFRKYHLELLDPLPGFNFQQAFGVIGPDNKPARVRYTKR